MLKLIALVVMVAGMVDVYLNSTAIGALAIFSTISLLYLIINILMNELSAED